MLSWDELEARLQLIGVMTDSLYCKSVELRPISPDLLSFEKFSRVLNLV